ncbi:hypothetical protein VOLCADRAFT_118195 [Volvox carteri f. nagariensis]|uniref:Guanylate cyclase domain-containing protein n=1 Tax=Volvox carteri f. nagariensis TaxID=3068 RepID=D8U2N8_VOLCA|nr:uncharacterized protein VOLCADRAFT_118195 [Volvox carteri f. nagariensis]EFJ45840.1 hypothetical protein VOLCADRAFT_118195 [Volvox carteri f. nagariensis]|eukprot:XP_002952918.1 hypothetical protein VOLCADRAFT_118195 [Volvox carteri f. nagariensis]
MLLLLLLLLQLLLVVHGASASPTQIDKACLGSTDSSAVAAAAAAVAACLERRKALAVQSPADDLPPSPAPAAVQPLLSLPPLPLPPLPSPKAGVQGPSGEPGASGFKSALWAVLAVAGVLLVALAVVLYKYRRLQRRHIQERGAQRAPGVGPMTTLLITDIANSTGLWESLPEEVMDQALKLHHACLRALLQRFNGYESATEGDSFILAFHYPADAAKFALSAQFQLMDVMWPAEVLAHPDGQEVWVVPRSAELANAGSLHSIYNTMSSSLHAEFGGGGGGGGGSMSVQRSSAGRMISAAATAAASGAIQRSSDIGFSGYGDGGGGGGGFLRASWTGRAKSVKVLVPAGPHSAGVATPGAVRSAEVERLSASEVDTEDLTYGGDGRTGSGLLRSFTSRMSTMLGLVPASGGGGGGAGGGRPSSRMGRFLRISAASVAVKSPEDYRPQSLQGFSDRQVMPRLPASASHRRRAPGAVGGDGASVDTGRADLPPDVMRSKSFGGRILAGGVLPTPRLGSAAVAGARSGSSHSAGAAGALPLTTSTPTGSFTSGARSLLRQALSFNWRQGSFHSRSRAAAAAVSVSAAAAAGNAAPGVTTATTATNTTTCSAALPPSSPASPIGSRCTGSYSHLPRIEDPAAAAAEAGFPEGAARRITAEGGGPLSSREGSAGSVTTGAGGVSTGSSSKGGGLFRNGLLRLGRGSGAVNRSTLSPSGTLRTAKGGLVATSGPTALALAMSSDGRLRGAAARGSSSGGGAPSHSTAAASSQGASQSTAARSSPTAATGGHQRNRRSRTHGLYGDVVAGVGYGRGGAVQPRLPSSYDGTFRGSAVKRFAAAAEAAATAAGTMTDGSAGGVSASQAAAFTTAYESEITTGAMFASIVAAGSSNASAAMVMDVLEAASAAGDSGTQHAEVHRPPAPRVPQFRSALLLEDGRGDGRGPSMTTIQQAYLRRSSAPPNICRGTATVGTATAAADMPESPPPPLALPAAAEAYGAAGGGGTSNMTAANANAAAGVDEPAAGGGMSRSGGGSSDGGGDRGATSGASSRQRLREMLCRRPAGGADGTPSLERPSPVMTHNQLYGTDADSDTHVRLNSSSLPVSNSIKLLLEDVQLLETCGAVMKTGRPAEPGMLSAATAEEDVAAAADAGGAASAADATAAAPAAAAVEEVEATAVGSSPLRISLENVGTASCRDGPDTTSGTIAAGSESMGISSSCGVAVGGPRSFSLMQSRAAGSSPRVISPTSGGAGGASGGSGGSGGGASLSAALARLMRARGRDVRVYSSSAVRSGGPDGDNNSSCGGSRGGSLAPIQEPNATAKHPHSQRPFPTLYRRHIRASSGGIFEDSAPLPQAATLAADGESAAGGSASAGQLSVIGIGSGGGGIGSCSRGFGGGAAMSPATGQSPSASRTGSMTVGSVSQTLARGWSRANGLVRQLTRDRSVSRAARRSATGNLSLDMSLHGGGGGGGGSGAASGLMVAAANAFLVASDVDADSGAELSAIGILADGLRSRAAGASASGAVSKLHAVLMPTATGSAGAGSGDEAPGSGGEVEAVGRGRHCLSARMVTIDLGAALAAVTDEETGAAPPSASTSARLADPPGPLPPPPPPRSGPRSASRLSASQLFAMAGGGGGNGRGGGGGGGGPASAPPLVLPMPLSSGPASRRISFLGLGLGPRSRTAERRSSATEEWQGSQGEASGAWAAVVGSRASAGVGAGGGGAHSQPLSALVVECRSWKERCREEWPLAMRPAPPARCAYRGLRVRMGLHTGITTASDVTFNPTTSHMAYGGTAMKVAKAVGDAAAGGMILMSQPTFQALVPVMLELPGSPQAVFSGESDLDLGTDSAHYCLYQLVHRELLGTEDAPTGACAISFMHVASASMLVAELGQPGVEALQQFKSIATGLCSRCGGYVVEASEGLCLAAFRHAAAALVWALASREALATHPWSAEVNAATGRMTYRGKVMNRTSRIAHKATSEQILCSKDAWDAVEASLQRMVDEIHEEQRREQEAMREAAAAAQRAAATTSSTVEADGDDGYGDVDMVSELGTGGGGGPGSATNSLRAMSPVATPSSRRLPSGGGGGGGGSKHTSPASAGRGAGGGGGGGKQANAGRRSGGSGGSKPGSAPSSARSDMSQITAAGASTSGAAAAAAAAGRIPSITVHAVSGGGGSGIAGTRGSSAPSATGILAAAAAAAAARSPSLPSPHQPLLRIGSFPLAMPLASGLAHSPSMVAVGGSGTPVGFASSGAPLTIAASTTPNLHLALRSTASEVAASRAARDSSGDGEAATAAAAAAATPASPGLVGSGSGGGDDGHVSVPAPPPPSVRWQALSRLVGPKVPLPPAKSLKGVREEMKLFEVFWGDEEQQRSPASNAGGVGVGVGVSSDQECGRRSDGGGGNGDSQRHARADVTSRGSGLGVATNAVEAAAAAQQQQQQPGAVVRDGLAGVAAAAAERGDTWLAGARGYLPKLPAVGTGSSPFTSTAGAAVAAVAAAAAASASSASSALPLAAQPVMLSSATLWRTRSGKLDWPVTDTAGSVYDDDLSTGGAFHPADTPDALAYGSALGPEATFKDATAAAAAGAAAPNNDGGGGGGGGGSPQTRIRQYGGLFPSVGNTVTELISVQERGPGSADAGGSGGGGGGGGGSRYRATSAGGGGGGGGGWLQPRQSLPFPPPSGHHQHQHQWDPKRVASGPDGVGEPATPCGTSVPWSVPVPVLFGVGERPSSAVAQARTSLSASPAGPLAPPRASQLQLPQLHPKSQPRPYLGNEALVGTSGAANKSPCYSPSASASPSPPGRCGGAASGAAGGGVGGDVSTGSSSGIHRRRHPSGTMAVTFAEHAIQEPAKAQPHSPVVGYRHSAFTASQATRTTHCASRRAGASTGHLEAAAGGGMAALAAVQQPPPPAEAAAAQQRQVSATTPVRVLQPSPLAPSLEPVPLPDLPPIHTHRRMQPPPVWMVDGAVAAAAADMSDMYGPRRPVPSAAVEEIAEEEASPGEALSAAAAVKSECGRGRRYEQRPGPLRHDGGSSDDGDAAAVAEKPTPVIVAAAALAATAYTDDHDENRGAGRKGHVPQPQAGKCHSLEAVTKCRNKERG